MRKFARRAQLLLFAALLLLLAWASEPEAFAADNAATFSVTVPSVLPVVVSGDGTVTVATDARIVNNSVGTVKLDSISVTPLHAWELDDWDTDYSTVPVDSRQFSMQLGDASVPASGVVDVSGYAAIGAGGSMALSYDARIAAQTSNLSETIANVVFTVSWADGAPTVEPEPVYAILYSDGELVFQRGDTPESGRTVAAIYGDVETATSVPWSAKSASIKTATFLADVAPVTVEEWFCDSRLSTINHIEKLDTSNVTSMASMFEESYITSLDLTSFDTSHVTSFARMFAICEDLESLDVSGWNTSAATAMNAMFDECTSLTSLDLSSWDTANVQNMNSMFDECYILTSLNLSGWNTANVTAMDSMFADCRRITTLDVSSFNTARVTRMNYMFYNCKALTTIYASEDFVTADVTDAPYIFRACTNLVGGNGTVYVNTTDGYGLTNARIDAPGAPGYFTAKTASLLTAVAPLMVEQAEAADTLDAPTEDSHAPEIPAEQSDAPDDFAGDELFTERGEPE